MYIMHIPKCTRHNICNVTFWLKWGIFYYGRLEAQPLFPPTRSAGPPMVVGGEAGPVPPRVWPETFRFGQEPGPWTRDFRPRFHGEAGGPQDLVPPADLALQIALAERRPCARAHLAERDDRESCPLLRAAFFLAIRREQWEHGLPLTPPCRRCGLPTGSWCDACRAPLCTACDAKYGQCGPCAGAQDRARASA